MPVVNNGVLDGVRRIGAKVRDLTVDGGVPGAPLGFRLRGASTAGPPTTGTWKTGDEARDRAGGIWICTAGGTPGTWVAVGHASPLSLYAAAAGATAEIVPRTLCTGTASGAVGSGTLYVNGIGLPAGLAVNNITLFTSTTPVTTADLTHGWYCLLDSGLVIRAISADQISPATTWGTASTGYTLAVLGAGGSTYTTTYSGLYYVGVMVSTSAGSEPNWACCTAGQSVTNIWNAAPVLSGASTAFGTGGSAPPSPGGSAQTAITVSGNHDFYAYLS